MELKTLSIEKTSHRESSCNVIVLDGHLLMVELRSSILWPCGNRRYLCLRLLPRAVTEETGEEEEEEEEEEVGEAHVCQRCTMRELYIIPLWILIEASLSAAKSSSLPESWIFMTFAYANAKFLGRTRGSSEFQIRLKGRSRERFCAARILDMARLRRRFIMV